MVYPVSGAGGEEKVVATGDVEQCDLGTQYPSPDWIEDLQTAVLAWYSRNRRNFPWRDTTNPFHILIAEVLLRQTQAERVIGPYLELVQRYPDAFAMASANVDQLREWFRPLGLGHRADRLVQTARILVKEFGGQIPHNLERLMKMPGLGIYSGRAILCLSFGDRSPMVDEASGRVLVRVFGLPVRRPSYSDPLLLEIAERVLPSEAAKFNLGLIDIAAACCHPRSPDCLKCPLSDMCMFSKSSRTN